MARKTQHELIADYMDRFESITPYDAFRDLGITKLATRISEMRKAGAEISGENETGINRFGAPITYKRYRWVDNGVSHI